MILIIIIVAVQLFWGATLLVKAATEESTPNIARVQRLVGLLMFVMAVWELLVYCN